MRPNKQSAITEGRGSKEEDTRRETVMGEFAGEYSPLSHACHHDMETRSSMLPSETMTTMADCNITNDKSLKHVPKIDHSHIYLFAKENSLLKEMLREVTSSSVSRIYL